MVWLGRRQEVTAESQASGIMSFPRRNQTSAGRSWLEQPSFLFLGTEADFVVGNVEDVGNRFVSVTVPSSWADSGVITKAIQDLATQEALCDAMLQGRVGSASQSLRNELDPPPSQAPAPRT